MLRWIALALVGAWAMTIMATPATARPYAVDDLLRSESFGQIAVDPAERLMVFERLRPRTSAPAFDQDYFTRNLRSELFVVELARPAAARRLLPAAEGVGHVLGPWSPSGRQLVVYRLRDRRWTVGIVDLEQRSVRWLHLSPETPSWGRTVQWRSDESLAMIVTADGRPPAPMRPWAGTERLAELWSAQRDGRAPSRTVVGSGAFADRSPELASNRLVLVDTATGRTRRLAEGRFHDLELSTGGRFAAVLDFDRRSDVDQRPGPLIPGEWPHHRAVRVVDLESGEVWSPPAARQVLPNLLTWSPVSDDLLVWGRTEGEPWAAGRLIRLDAAARTATRLSLGRFSPALRETPGLRTPLVAAEWLGDDPVIYATGATGRRDWVRVGSDAAPLTAALSRVPERLAARGRDQVWIFAEGGLWRLQGAGAARLTPPDTTVTPSPQDLIDVGQRFAFNHPVRRETAPAALTPDGRPWQGISAPGLGGTTAATPASPPLTRFVGAGVRVVEKVDARFRQSLWLEPAAAASVKVASLNDHHVDITFAERRAVHHRGPSGEPLTSWLHLPSAEARVGRSGAPPLVVVPYPGVVHAGPPRSADPTASNVMISVPILTGAGFAVLLPSLPRDGQPGEPAAGLEDQVLAAVDAAAADGGFDPERLALWGHSFGGLAAAGIASRTDRFDAVVGASGVYDLTAAWGEFTPQARVLPEEGLSIRSRAGWVEAGQGGMGGPPWTDPDRYRRNSPLFAANRISAPMLLIASDRDYISLSQAEAMFSALYRRNQDAVLLTYFGEGHVFDSPANLRDMTAYVTGWLWTVLAPRAKADHRSQGGTSPLQD